MKYKIGDLCLRTGPSNQNWTNGNIYRAIDIINNQLIFQGKLYKEVMFNEWYRKLNKKELHSIEFDNRIEDVLK